MAAKISTCPPGMHGLTDMNMTWRAHARTVQVRVCLVRDEELAAIGVGAAVGHRHHAALAVLQRLQDLVRELAVGRGIDALPALAGPCRRSVAEASAPQGAEIEMPLGSNNSGCAGVGLLLA